MKDLFFRRAHRLVRDRSLLTTERSHFKTRTGHPSPYFSSSAGYCHAFDRLTGWTQVLAGVVALARSLYRTGEGIALEGWEYPVAMFLRKKRSKIFMADDPVPGSMNKVFKLDVDLR